MATFNQQDQRVQHQVNGEHVYVGTDGSSAQVHVERIIDQLMQRLRAEQVRQDVAEAVLTQVEAARTAAHSGDRRRVVAFLSRAAEAAAPVATLAGSVAAVVNDIVTIWHD